VNKVRRYGCGRRGARRVVPRRRLGGIAILAGALMVPATTAAQASRRSAGIILRGSAWSLGRGPSRLVWQSDDLHTLFDEVGVAGWISFVGRTEPNLDLELSLGTVLRTVEEVKHAQGTDTYVEAAIPLLIGLRVHPVVPGGGGVVPYVSVGLGPYWVGDVVSTERFAGDHTSVSFETRFGGYVGGGADFMIADWFGLNLDLKRHFVDVRAPRDLSGFEYGAGMVFLWGRRSASR